MTDLSPDSVALAEEASGWHSIYLHIPFCDAICPYCDFAVVAGRDSSIDRYLAALRREIADEPAWGPLQAVFFGGGTPSRIPADAIGVLIGDLRERFGLVDDVEISLEANPEDVTGEKAAGLVEAGVNRVSLGGQSFDDRVLAGLGRRHLGAHVDRAIGACRAAGVGSVSLDLIFGTPGESLRSWETTVSRAIEAGVDHVSVYGLTVEPPTPLGKAVRRGAPAPDPDLQADMWELAAGLLAAAGLVRYEISNHARAGHVCRYNLSVWGMGEYLGFGLGAHGFRDGLRRRNVRRLDTYLERVERGVGPVQGVEAVEGFAFEKERLMVGLRRTAGVETGDGGVALLSSDDGRRLVEAGVLGERGGRLVVARPLLTDAVTRAVLSLGTNEL